MQIKNQQNPQYFSVHKFGGASVKNSSAVRNVATILHTNLSDPAVVVVSAMGKTTNALENIFKILNSDGFDKAQTEISEIIFSHNEISRELEIGLDLSSVFYSALEEASQLENIDARYDALVASGEDASTRILAEFLRKESFDVVWRDVRDVISTDERHREARVDESDIFKMGLGLRTELSSSSSKSPRIVVTQGFIGRSKNGSTTTLGREGSDYSAALLACAIGSKEVVIWKDVPGMLNADPKVFSNTVTVTELDYGEALELSYYGASVIHPRTIKPLQNDGIPLYLRSFIDPDAPRTRIGAYPGQTPSVPMYISRPNVVRLSLGPSDRSFVGEDHLSTVFGALNSSGIHIRMMQNSAIQFDLVFDEDDEKLKSFIKGLGNGFWTKLTSELDLLTIKHGEEELIEELTAGREVLMEQKCPSTVRRLLS